MSAIDPGQIAFHDDYTPSLPADTYTVSATQTLDVPDAEIPSADMVFEVIAPQFTLDGGQLHAMYPPANGTGDYADDLPFIVLNDRMLPWERALPGYTDAPWLALLLFTEDELVGDPGPVGTFTQTGTIADLLAGTDTTLAPALTVDNTDRPCTFIEITGAAFEAVVPMATELPFLAHVREINTGDTALLGMKDDGWFSVVLSNRFPTPPVSGGNGLRNIAHLVSLEGYQDYLGGYPATLPTQPDGTTPKNVRLVSLTSWIFTCAPHAGTSFAGLMQGLTGQSGGTLYTADALRLRLPPPASANGDAAVLVQQRLADGHVALPYHSLSGEDTYAWYRGPLTPAPMPYAEKPAPFVSVSQAMVYDEDNGLFDQTLAAAWQLGRTLALADAGFANALMAFRREGRALVEAYLAAENAATFLAAPSPRRLKRGHRAKTTSFLQLGTLRSLSAVFAPTRRRKRRTLMPKRTRLTATPVASLKTVTTQSDAEAVLAEKAAAMIAPLAEWIGRKSLFFEVPFNHLVPDPFLLPPESLRFFYVDQNWLDAFGDGALSLGLQSGRDIDFQTMLRQAIRDAAFVVASNHRDALAGTDPDPGTADAPELQAGFLIRSALASGWPGVQIQATQAGQPLKLLRMDHLAPDVLFALYLGVPDAVTFTLPHEGLTFGLIDDAGDGIIELRTLSGSDLGTPLSPTTTFTVYDADPPGGTQPYFRDDTHRVLSLDALVPALSTAAGTPLTPATFALEMVQSSELASFAPSA